MTRKLANPNLQPPGRRKADSIAPQSRGAKQIPIYAPVPASPLARLVAPLKNLVVDPYGTCRRVFYPQDRLLSAVINAVAERGPVSLQEAYKIYFASLRAAERISVYRKAGDGTLAGHLEVGLKGGNLAIQSLDAVIDPMLDALASRTMERGVVYFLQERRLLYINPNDPGTIREKFAKQAADNARILMPLGKDYGMIDVRGSDLRFKNLVTPPSATIVSARDISKLFSLRFVADVDPLTGLASRLAYEEGIRHQINIRKSTGMNAALLMLDIDFFKKVNDTYGHDAGDKVLAKVAAIASMVLRSSDLVTKSRALIGAGDEMSRYGGEEFAAVLSGSDTLGAVKAAQRCRRAIEENPVQLPSGEEIPITVSMGISSLSDAERIVNGELDIDPEFMAHVSFEDLENQMILPGNGERMKSLRETWQKISDQALYIAKRLGRNRIGIPELVEDSATGRVSLKFHSLK
ncbi:diguanylate cyclase [Candidatus Micrarchaeota archaeon]|nr:diguanylate cyclase [Candidatus Micrarchaeota archaeon]MBD3418169.1 diguanylate cyclase [Candidatus Micrarchaeota archaeon]